ncbi:MAG: hypothetical protein LBG58_12415 [Planctomycetaceae bacterium]|jgi:hypothetical protein|nr:hypothetical protein [Planctomycetaceae bacterium]
MKQNTNFMPLKALVGFPAYRSEIGMFFRNLPLAALKGTLETTLKTALKTDAMEHVM